MSISGTNYEYLYLLDFTLFYRNYTYNLIDPISRERTVTDGVHVFAALDLVYSYTIHAKNPNVLKHKIFNYSIRFKGTHTKIENSGGLSSYPSAWTISLRSHHRSITKGILEKCMPFP